MISLVTHTRKFSMAPHHLRDEATSLLPSTMGPRKHTERPGPGRWESKEDNWEDESKLDENELDDKQHLLRPQTEQSRSSKEEASFKVGSLPRARVCACGICPRIVKSPQDELCPHTTLAPASPSMLGIRLPPSIFTRVRPFAGRPWWLWCSSTRCAAAACSSSTSSPSPTCLCPP